MDTRLIKSLVLVTIKLLFLLSISTFYMKESYESRAHIIHTERLLVSSASLGNLIHYLQRERDQSVLYLSTISPLSKTFLLRRYIDTDNVLEELEWPDLMYASFEFRTKLAFRSYLKLHRVQLDVTVKDIFTEILYYTKIIKTLVKWLYVAVDETKDNNIWKSLVAYMKLIESKENAGVERALGTYFFSHGLFSDISYYRQYLIAVNQFRKSYIGAADYSNLVSTISTQDIRLYGEDISEITNRYHEQLSSNSSVVGSLERAIEYFDAMTANLDQLLLMQKQVERRLVDWAKRLADKRLVPIIVTAIVIIITCILSPFLVRGIWSVAKNTRMSNVLLTARREKLEKAKQRTFDLMAYMLPQCPLGRSSRCKTDADYYTEVTVCFSDIIGFHTLVNKISPEKLITIINRTDDIMHDALLRFKLFNVEIIAAGYMITSGLTNPCSTHAVDVANFTLKVMTLFNLEDFKPLTDCSLSLRFGIHSGSVMAGIIQTKILRYRVFGNTVDIALKLQMSASGNTIHISSQTWQTLVKTNSYQMESKNQEPFVNCLTNHENVQSKDKVKTYILLGHQHPDSRPSPLQLDGPSAPAAQPGDFVQLLRRVSKEQLPGHEAKLGRAIANDADNLKTVQINIGEIEVYRPGAIAKLLQTKDRPTLDGRKNANREQFIAGVHF